MLSRIRVLKRSGLLESKSKAESGSIETCPKHRAELDREIAKRVGRCRNLHPLDCGRPRCGVCSPEKRWGRTATPQEGRAEISYAESCQNLLESDHDFFT